MPVENHHVSSFLRKIVRDPATTKLLTILFSTILIVVTTERARKQACASFILAVTQLSTITLVFAGEINRPETHVVCD
uniref:Uncharacterized protein n=1 Tax=Panagrolaimus davidi TaxID=227884 RepID=A0A914QWI5_9BILA